MRTYERADCWAFLRTQDSQGGIAVGRLSNMARWSLRAGGVQQRNHTTNRTMCQHTRRMLPTPFASSPRRVSRTA